MKRLFSLLFLFCLIPISVFASCLLYLYLYRDTGAVPSALLAGVTTIGSYEVTCAGPESDAACLRAYRKLKETTGICLIQNRSDSRFNCTENLVYLTQEDFARDSMEAVHEYGHALDRALFGGGTGYFSRQEPFAAAYDADTHTMRQCFDVEDFFRGEAFRNPAVSDILFASFYEECEVTAVLTASYQAAGTPYWRHETEYMSEENHRRTEVFADIFVILLSDDEQAKNFLQAFFPVCTEQLLENVKKYVE